MNTIRDLLRSLRWRLTRHKLRLTLLVMLVAATAPWQARAQFVDPCCAILSAGLASIQSALQNVIGGALNQILAVDNSIAQYQQTVVWPQNLIAQAQALVVALQGTIRQIRSLSRISISSATLPASQQLEQVLLSANPVSVGRTTGAYTALYGPVPMAASASPQVLNMVDMSDAAAQAAMKRAIEIDALADLEIQAADQLNQSIQNAAPGSAPIIEAQADAWLIRAQAYTQSATADLMRLHSIALATASADIKLGAANTTSLRQAIANLLQHQ